MTNQDFYKVAAEFQPEFQKHGLKKSGKSYVSSTRRYKVTLKLDRNGWDNELGWGFILEATDESVRDEWGNIVGQDARFQVGGRHVSKFLDPKVISDLYAKKPKIQSLLKSNWVGFSNGDHLRSVLQATLPVLLDAYDKWARGSTRMA